MTVRDIMRNDQDADFHLDRTVRNIESIKAENRTTLLKIQAWLKAEFLEIEYWPGYIFGQSSRAIVAGTQWIRDYVPEQRAE